MLQFYIYRYLTSALIGDEGFQRPKISVAFNETENTRLASSIFRCPIALAATIDPPTPSKMPKQPTNDRTGTDTLTAEIASGPIKLLTTMASINVDSSCATDDRIEAHMNVWRAMDIR